MSRTLIVLTTVGFWSLLAPSAHANEGSQTWTREFQVSPHPTVRIDTHDARVAIHSWKDSRVKVHVENRGQTSGLVFGRRRPVVEIGQEGNEVRVRARYDGSDAGILVISTSRLQVELWVPGQCDLAVTSGDGSVSVEEVTGRIGLEVRDGSVTGSRLGGDLDIRAADGRVLLEDLDGSLRLEAHDGHSRIRGRFDRLDVESSDGGIEADALPGSKIGEGWALRSSDGGIRLRIPHDFAATLDARTGDGGLVVDLPVRTRGRFGNHEVLGEINGGGATLRLRTSDGSIRVEAAD